MLDAVHSCLSLNRLCRGIRSMEAPASATYLRERENYSSRDAVLTTLLIVP